MPKFNIPGDEQEARDASSDVIPLFDESTFKAVAAAVGAESEKNGFRFNSATINQMSAATIRKAFESACDIIKVCPAIENRPENIRLIAGAMIEITIGEIVQNAAMPRYGLN